MLASRPALLLIVLTCSSASASAEPADGLLGHWTFDDAQGDLAEDASGNHNDADVWGARWVKGAFGTALHFGGSDSYVSVAQIDGLDGSDELTVEAWILWEAGGQYPNIITGGTWSPGGFLVFVRDESCSFRLGRPRHKAGTPGSGWKEISSNLLSKFELGKWYHLAATFKRPDITTYVNGQKVGSAKWDYPVGYSGDIQIGRWGGAQDCHKGLIDEVKLYSRALSAAEVHASYTAEAPRRDQAEYEVVPESARRGVAMAAFETEFMRFEVDARGRCVALVDKRTGDDYLEKTVPLGSVTVDGKVIRRATCTQEDGKLTLRFGRKEATAVIGVTPRDGYLVFEVLSVEGEGVERLTFLALDPKPAKHGMAMSGAMAYDDFTICVRALNVDTQVGSRGSLSATGYDDYRVVGAKAALVACPTDQTLPTLQKLVRAEGVPQSSLGGPSALAAEGTRGSYLFARVTESNVDWWIDLAKRAGFTHIHFSTWGKSLGHYEPNPALFPNGLDGMKAVVRKIHDAGLKAGMHTLTGCIATRDPWVTPVPDKRLKADASYTLAADMDEKSDTILTVEKPGNHDVVWGYASGGNVIRIGEELIHYEAISYEPPYGFTKCKRGAFKTKPSAHAKGEAADHLLQRYLAFYADEKTTLVGEVADCIANAYNECGFDQIYMDGAEGMGNWHATEVMRDAIYQRLKRPAIVEASSWGHWSWYYHSRVGAWDHPKWGLKQFTDMHVASIPMYRQGGLVQAQLGWWVILGPSWSNNAEMPDEMEYFLCKTMAHDAPISIQGISAGGRPANARQDEYLTLAGQYERLRLANYFTGPVLERTREPGQEFHLQQADDGEWQFVPTDYLSHKVAGLHDGSQEWTVNNPHGEQPLRLRLEVLRSALPYDSEDALLVADASMLDRFTVHRNANGVTHTLAPAAQPPPPPVAGLLDHPITQLSATSKLDRRRGAWAHAGMKFTPYLSIGQRDAMGVWIHGDGKDEVLNLQLVTPREHMHCYAEHYVMIDFEGWRYFELLLRERDADKYHDYQWPYFSQHGIFRTFLNRAHVGELNLYLNELPPGETATVYLGPVKALRTRSVTLNDPTLEVNGRKLSIAVPLRSDSVVELDGTGACQVRDGRLELQRRLELASGRPVLRPGENQLRFSCQGEAGSASRAEVTVIAAGAPLRGKAADDQIDWAVLRDEYELPRTILALDGRQNRWEVVCRPDAGPTGPTGTRAALGLELEILQVGATSEAYNDPNALTLESFDDLGFFADSPDNQFAKFVYDSNYKGIATKPGVTQELTQSTDPVKIGKSCARYTATSTLADSGGWSARGRRYKEPLDLTTYQGLGFWLHGDGKGESFKLQLRDKAGGWHDMVTRVDFTGWRYCQFDLAGADKLDAKNVEYLLIYYNGIPAKQTVTCYVDDVRALPRVQGLRNPELTVDGKRLVLPAELSSGDRLVYDGARLCRLYRKGRGEPEHVAPKGASLTLKPGRNTVVFGLGADSPRQFRAAVSLVKHYQ